VAGAPRPHSIDALQVNLALYRNTLRDHTRMAHILTLVALTAVAAGAQDKLKTVDELNARLSDVQRRIDNAEGQSRRTNRDRLQTRAGDVDNVCCTTKARECPVRREARENLHRAFHQRMLEDQCRPSMTPSYRPSRKASHTTAHPTEPSSSTFLDSTDECHTR
jgi:hypothetical protein